MPFAVRADVVDIASDTPTEQDRFLVDTNVWVWLTYDRLSTHHPNPPKDYQLNTYPAYLKKARQSKAALYATPYHFAELARVIEGAELEIHRFQSRQPDFPLKRFRHETEALYGMTLGSIFGAWDTVKSLASIVSLSVAGKTIDGMRDRMDKRQLVDPVDLLVIQALIPAGITQFLTDDSDYTVIPGIAVFTANPKMLQLAKAQGRLLTRKR